MIKLGFEEWHMGKLYEKKPTAKYVQHQLTELTSNRNTYILEKAQITHDKRDNLNYSFEILFCQKKRPECSFMLPTKEWSNANPTPRELYLGNGPDTSRKIQGGKRLLYQTGRVCEKKKKKKKIKDGLPTFF